MSERWQNPPSNPARITVVGDLMVDRTRWISTERVDSASSGIFAREVSVCDQPGGAAYVAALLRHLHADVLVGGAIGDDAEGEFLSARSSDAGMQSAVFIDPSRPTTLKERFVSGATEIPRVLARVDRESTEELKTPLVQSFCCQLTRSMAACDGLLISDYAKGVCTASLLQSLIAVAHVVGVPIVVDPTAHTSWERYIGCDVITPNRREAEQVTGLTIDDRSSAIAAGRSICDQLPGTACVLTLDAEGALLVSSDGHVQEFAARPTTLVDATGAGDAFAATLMLSLAEGNEMSDAVRLANDVAAMQVAQFGTALVSWRPPHDNNLKRTIGDTSHKVQSLESLSTQVESRRRQGQQIVLANGCFDLLHPGHVTYLEQARAEGDCLVVAMNSDSTVNQLKGETRPVLSETERSRMLAALACIDFVVIFEEPTPHATIRRLKPDVLVKGGDYALADVVGRELVESYGGTVRTLGLTPGISTTRLLERMSNVSIPLSETG